MGDEPRVMTVEECRERFLGYVRSLVTYWHTNKQSEGREKLDGLAFSVLVLLDGESGLPGFTVTPRPCPEDEAYHRENGDNWWPNDVDIAGPLHEEWCNPPKR